MCPIHFSAIEKRLIDSIADAVGKELFKNDMKKLVSERTASICASVSFNGLTGRLTDEIIYIDVPVIEEKDLSDKFCYLRKHYSGYRFGEIHWNTSLVSFKQLKPTSFNERLLLAHELKLLTHIGSHDSIVCPLGITEIENRPASLFKYVSRTDLESFGKVEFKQLKWIVTNLSSALTFLQSKGIILNNLVEGSIFMKEPETYFSLPVIVDFSSACLESTAMHLNIHHREKFSKTNHLPIDVLNGKRKPSFSSDIYSFACLMANSGKRLSCYTPLDKRQLVEATSFKLKDSTRQCFARIIERFLSYPI